MDKYDIANVLLNEASEEKEHLKSQKAREQEWKKKGGIVGGVAGLGTGLYAAKKVWGDKPANTKLGAVGRVAKTVGAGVGTALATKYIAKKIAWTIARMTRKGYTKQQIDQAVKNIKKQAGI